MCTYCKKSGHDVTRCFRKQNNDRYNNNSGNLPRSGDTSGARPINLIAAVEEDFEKCLHIVSVLNNNHVTCQSVKIRKEFIELLVDTGSAVNLIKFSALTGDTLVHENRKIYLRGINDNNSVNSRTN